MAFCVNCGQRLDDGVNFCPNCGTPTGQTQGQSQSQGQRQSQGQGMFNIKCEGLWMLIDATVHLSVNGKRIGDYSLKRGFEVSIPITTSNIVLGVKYSFRNQTPVYAVNPSENYNLIMTYNRIMGNYDFMLFDQNGKRIK